MASKTVSTINGGLINSQSVGNKTLEIHDLITDENFDLLAVTETWLNEYEQAKRKEMTPITHTILHTPRKDRRGGGVRIYLKKNF